MRKCHISLFNIVITIFFPNNSTLRSTSDSIKKKRTFFFSREGKDSLIVVVATRWEKNISEQRMIEKFGEPEAGCETERNAIREEALFEVQAHRNMEDNEVCT